VRGSSDPPHNEPGPARRTEMRSGPPPALRRALKVMYLKLRGTPPLRPWRLTGIWVIIFSTLFGVLLLRSLIGGWSAASLFTQPGFAMMLALAIALPAVGASIGLTTAVVAQKTDQHGRWFRSTFVVFASAILYCGCADWLIRPGVHQTPEIRWWIEVLLTLAGITFISIRAHRLVGRIQQTRWIVGSPSSDPQQKPRNVIHVDSRTWLALQFKEGWAVPSIFSSAVTFAATIMIVAWRSTGNLLFLLFGGMFVVGLLIALLIIGDTVGSKANGAVKLGRTICWSFAVPAIILGSTWFALPTHSSKELWFSIFTAVALSVYGGSRTPQRGTLYVATVGNGLVAIALVSVALSGAPTTFWSVILAAAVYPVVWFLDTLLLDPIADATHLARGSRFRQDLRWLVLATFPLSKYVEDTSAHAAVLAALILPVSAIAFGRLLMPPITHEYSIYQIRRAKPVEEAPSEKSHDDDASAFSGESKRIAAQYGALAIAGLVSFVLLVLTTGKTLGFAEGTLHFPFPWVAFSGIAAASVVFLAFRAIEMGRADKTVPHASALCLAGIFLAGTTGSACAAIFLDPDIIHAQDAIPMFQILESVLASIWITLSAVNQARMRGIQTRWNWFIAISLGACHASIYCWIATAGMGRPEAPVDWLWPCLAILLTLPLTLLTAGGAGRLMVSLSAGQRNLETDWTRTKLSSAIMQDCGVWWLMSAVTLGAPSLIITHVQSMDERFETILLLIISFFLFASVILVWGLRNNLHAGQEVVVRHGSPAGYTRKGLSSLPVERSLLLCRVPEIRAVMIDLWRPREPDSCGTSDAASDELAFARIVRGHLNLQNIISLLAFCMTGVGLVALINEIEFAGKGEREFASKKPRTH
jgi:hypothetical protein